MNKTKRRILIYDDEGVSPTSVLSLLSLFSQKINVPTVVKTVNAKQIICGVLSDADVLIMPGGADLPYCRKLADEGNRQISDFVTAGKAYIGICAGAYYASSYVDFTGNKDRIYGKRELALFEGSAVGSISELSHGRFYDGHLRTKAIAKLRFANAETAKMHYHGGPFFTCITRATVLANYCQNQQPAVITGTFGSGQYLLSGVHFELCPNVYRQQVIQHAKTRSITAEKSHLSLLEKADYGRPIYRQIEILLRQL